MKNKIKGSNEKLQNEKSSGALIKGLRKQHLDDMHKIKELQDGAMMLQSVVDLLLIGIAIKYGEKVFGDKEAGTENELYGYRLVLDNKGDGNKYKVEAKQVDGKTMIAVIKDPDSGGEKNGSE